MRSRLSRSTGFSLIETLITLGILSIGGYFLVTLMKNSMTAQKSVTAVDDMRSAIADMSAGLRNPAACLATFGGMSPASTTTVPAIKSADGSSKFAPGNAYGNRSAQLVSIQMGGSGVDPVTGLARYEASSSVSGIALVIVNFQKKKDSAGPADLTRYFKIRVTLDAAHKITACEAIGTGNADELWQRSGTNPDDIHYTGGNVGVGVSNPRAKLEISGELRVGSAGLACNSGGAGSVRYNSAKKEMEFCDGTDWKAMGVSPRAGPACRWVNSNSNCTTGATPHEAMCAPNEFVNGVRTRQTCFIHDNTYTTISDLYCCPFP